MRKYLPRTIGLAVSFLSRKFQFDLRDFQRHNYFNWFIFRNLIFVISQLPYSLKQRAISDCDVTLRYNDMIFVRTS